MPCCRLPCAVRLPCCLVCVPVGLGMIAIRVAQAAPSSRKPSSRADPCRSPVAITCALAEQLLCSCVCVMCGHGDTLRSDCVSLSRLETRIPCVRIQVYSAVCSLARHTCSRLICVILTYVLSMYIVYSILCCAPNSVFLYICNSVWRALGNNTS